MSFATGESMLSAEEMISLFSEINHQRIINSDSPESYKRLYLSINDMLVNNWKEQSKIFKGQELKEYMIYTIDEVERIIENLKKEKSGSQKYPLYKTKKRRFKYL